MSSMLAAGLAAGLALEDMRHMKYTHLMQILYEWDDMNGSDAEEVRDATGDDVRWMMSL